MGKGGRIGVSDARCANHRGESSLEKSARARSSSRPASSFGSRSCRGDEVSQIQRRYASLPPMRQIWPRACRNRLLQSRLGSLWAPPRRTRRLRCQRSSATRPGVPVASPSGSSSAFHSPRATVLTVGRWARPALVHPALSRLDVALTFSVLTTSSKHLGPAALGFP